MLTLARHLPTMSRDMTVVSEDRPAQSATPSGGCGRGGLTHLAKEFGGA